MLKLHICTYSTVHHYVMQLPYQFGCSEIHDFTSLIAAFHYLEYSAERRWEPKNPALITTYTPTVFEHKYSVYKVHNGTINISIMYIYIRGAYCTTINSPFLAPKIKAIFCRQHRPFCISETLPALLLTGLTGGNPCWYQILDVKKLAWIQSGLKRHMGGWLGLRRFRGSFTQVGGKCQFLMVYHKL